MEPLLVVDRFDESLNISFGFRKRPLLVEVHVLALERPG